MVTFREDKLATNCTQRTWTGHMQTFLPYADFEASVQALDYKRLGKQRVETYQILKALLGSQGGLHGGWARHPASRMWEGYELALLKYQEETIKEWVGVRGYKDTCWEKSCALFTPEQLEDYAAGNYEMPEWFGNEDFHNAHISNLLRKDSEFYALALGRPVPDNLEYIWPGKTLEEAKIAQNV